MTKITNKIRSAKVDDQSRLEHLAIVSGLFQPEDMEAFSGIMSAYFAGETDGDFWLVYEHGGVVTGAGYCGPEGFADRVYNLYFIAVEPDLQGESQGSDILKATETKCLDEGARILIIETSGLGSFALTRRFYRKHGYNEEARIREYYGPGDDKVIFWKKL